MIIKSTIQGSADWLLARKNTFGASEAAAMLGMSSYKTRDQLLHEKATGITPDVDPATQSRFDRGHAIEAEMRPTAEEIIGDELYPVTGALDSNERITASFDGLTMLNDVAWECKTLNEKLRESLSRGVIPDEYHPQLEQQLMVSGASKALFMAAQSPADYLTAWYCPNMDLRQTLLMGWRQFAIDMENYVPTEKVAQAVGAPVKDLPAIVYRLNGLALQSNLADYKAAAMQLVEDSKLPLETDQDFADRETLCKSFKAAEDKLKNIRDQVIGEVTDIDNFCKEVEQIGELIRQARLAGEKQITTRKEAIKAEIVRDAGFALTEFLAELSKTIHPLCLPSITADFTGAIKGKKTVESLKSACNDLLAQTKIEANQIANKIAINQNTLRELAKDHAFLFADAQQLVMKENDDLRAVIQNRINEYKAQAEEQLGSEKTVSQVEPSVSQTAPQSMPKVARTVEPAAPTREAIINLVADHYGMGAAQTEAYLSEFFGKKPVKKKTALETNRG
jgi:putative phage-type endonuclease